MGGGPAAPGPGPTGGLGWYTHAPAGAEPEDEDEDDYTVEGTDLRLMWDHGAGPLWSTGEGLLPDEPAWLRRALGLSDSLIADLLGWLRSRDELELRIVSGGGDSAGREELDRRAEDLVRRLQAELGERYTVRYKP